MRNGAPAAVCPQCRSVQAIRAPEYDGPFCVIRGRCSVCGTPIALHDVVALLRADLHRTRPQADRLFFSTDFDTLWIDEETGEVTRGS